MKHVKLLILSIISFYCCEKETPLVPDYNPGRLIEITNETHDLGLTQHKYEYVNNSIIDKYYFQDSEVFITNNYFDQGELKKIYYSFENSTEDFFIDSISFTYSNPKIIEVTYSDGNPDTTLYHIENGKIRYSTNKPASSGTDWRIDSYFDWRGDNLIKYEVHTWFLRPSPIIRTYSFQYTQIENPLYYSNIPRLMKEFTNPAGGNRFELSDLIPKCSRNLPSIINIYDDYIPEQDRYTLETKTFPNANKPYKVKITHSNHNVDYYDYLLSYEKL